MSPNELLFIEQLDALGVGGNRMKSVAPLTHVRQLVEKPLMYQVPMSEVAVTVAIPGAEPAEHFVYLHPYSEWREGPETMPDYLNGPRRFFPMIALGVPRMINRDHIMWVRYEKLPDLAELESTVVGRLTILELTDGTRLEGTVPIDRPREQSRISDVLNDPREQFMRIDDEGETYYVNKAFIRMVIPR